MACQLGHWFKCLHGVHSSGVCGLKIPLTPGQVAQITCVIPKKWASWDTHKGDKVLPYLRRALLEVLLGTPQAPSPPPLAVRAQRYFMPLP